jgi:hypothetical protein
MLLPSVALLQIVVAIGQRLLQNATNHNANTVNVGVVKMTRLLSIWYFILCAAQELSPPFQVLIIFDPSSNCILSATGFFRTGCNLNTPYSS